MLIMFSVHFIVWPSLHPATCKWTNKAAVVDDAGNVNSAVQVDNWWESVYAGLRTNEPKWRRRLKFMYGGWERAVRSFVGHGTRSVLHSVNGCPSLWLLSLCSFLAVSYLIRALVLPNVALLCGPPASRMIWLLHYCFCFCSSLHSIINLLLLSYKYIYAHYTNY